VRGVRGVVIIRFQLRPRIFCHMLGLYSASISNSLTLTSFLTLCLSFALATCSCCFTFSPCSAQTLQHSFHAPNCGRRCIHGVCWYSEIQPPSSIPEQNDQTQVDPSPVDNIPEIFRQTLRFEISASRPQKWYPGRIGCVLGSGGCLEEDFECECGCCE
jgi:hypothetical protein